MKAWAKVVCGAALAAAAVGCGTSYRWRSSVPERWRTVAVPTFRNESELMEIGAIASRQILREFQREGTFRVASSEGAAVEVQGVVKSVNSGNCAYSRRSGMRVGAYKMTANVLVSVIDRVGGRVLVDNRPYAVSTTFSAGQDLTTAERDASGRLADELARRVVDDVLNQTFEKGEAKQ